MELDPRLQVHTGIDVYNHVCPFQVHMVRESNRSQNIKEESILDQCLQNRGWVLKVSAFFGGSLFTFIADTCLRVCVVVGGGAGASQVLASIILKFDTGVSGSHWQESPEC